MGTWGTGILQNDTTADIWVEFKELYNKGLTPKEIRLKLEKEYKPQYDKEYYSEIWTGIAYGQWMCGEIEDYTVKKLKVATKPRWQALWLDDKKLLNKRIKAISDFIQRIQTARPNPLKRKKIVVRHAFFRKGDVIGIKINKNKHIAAIVTERQDFDNDGQNTIAFTDFIFMQKAKIEEVMKANMLYLDIGGSNNYYRGFYVAIFLARNMARQIDKALLIGKIKASEFLWLGITTPYGDWRNIEKLIEEQLNFLKKRKSERPIEVSVRQFLKRNDKLERILIEWDKKIYMRKIKPQNAM